MSSQKHQLEEHPTPNTQVPEYWENGIIPWMSSGEVHKKRVNTVAQKITELGFQSSSAKLFPKGTILVALAGQGKTRGTVAISEVELTTNQSIAGVIVKDKTVSPDYVYQNLDSRYEELRAASGGSGRAGLNLAIIGEQQVMLPPLPEQQKIAAILSSVDEVIEKTRAQTDKLKDLKTGMMQELLSKGIGHTEFKDSPVGQIPIGWEFDLVGNLFQIQLGKMLSKTAKIGKTPLPYLGNKNVQWGKVDTTDLETMDFSDRERNKFSLKFGDLLICEGGEVGRSAIWKGEIENCYYQKAIHRLRPVNAAYEPRLLLEYMRYAKARNLLADFISQTSIAHLTKEKLAAVPVPVPPMVEQRQIVELFTSIDTRIDTLTGKLQKISNLKKALMQDLLTGKVRVKIEEKEKEPVVA
ncbi:restriction endonuclease subunit S [Vreelandella profundi]|uniref:restriction endonuclease subunit S n=1 Tax=Vreelandella profundi TaxID=2852117 RepID=UPI001F0079E5|nr:restriction endonuclease subunit S [Halomonas profundi]